MPSFAAQLSDPSASCFGTSVPCRRRFIFAAGWESAARRKRRVAATLERTAETTRSAQLIQWLQDHGAPQQAVAVQEVMLEGNALDVTVAAHDLAEGDVALRIPEHLVITLSRVFEDETLAELLTSDKLSELACLTLYLMYEKKNGKKSVWYEFIKELDRIQARGQQGAKSPLLWDDGQVQEYLAGSPLVSEIKERLRGIEKEYAELDTVWFMAGSLFKSYPYDIPTEAFSLELFTQAFAAVQASVVHLQGVSLAKRFALVPLGPPLLSYASTAKAMLQFNRETEEVQLAVDRDYRAGEPIKAWCGPQPNRRLLLNYGIVTDDNPYDKIGLTVTLPHADPLFQAKRQVLQQNNLATQQTFQLKQGQGLPELLLPYMRLAHATDSEAMRRATLETCCAAPISPDNERTVLHQLASHLQACLAKYRTTAEEDEAIIASSSAGPRQKVATRLLRIEKAILNGVLECVLELPEASEALEEGWASGSAVIAVRIAS